MKNEKIWAHLMHLGYNFWTELPVKDGVKCFDCRKGIQCATEYLRCEKDMWTKTTDALAETGCNMIIVDIGEGLIYDSHPEIAIKGSWTKKELSDEIDRLKSKGFKVIPKINFSAGHDEWMGRYSRMVSSPEYYKFCDDIIDEACELFGNPEYLHIGMDEECFSIQEHMNMCVIRHGELYWHDIFRLVRRLEKHGVRTWMWADYVWHTQESKKSFIDHMSKDILCSNWYYGDFTEGGWLKDCYSSYAELEALGFDQVLTGGNYRCEDNFSLTVQHGIDNVAPERLKGFMMTTWMPTMKEYEQNLIGSANLMKAAYDKYADKL